MKTLKFQFIAALIAIAGITAACSIDNDNGTTNCFSSAYAYTDAIQSTTDTILVNVPLNINVTFKVANSCGTFKAFRESLTFPKVVAPLIEYSGCSCSENNVPQTKPYEFKSAVPGTFQLKFLKDASETYITKNIVVTAQ